VGAAIRRATDTVVLRLDEVVEAKADAAVLADTDGWNSIVCLRALKAVHHSPPDARAGASARR
jgi:hypothetical protein